MESISLFELNEYIQRVFALNFEEAIWVHFELSNVKESRGHLYFDCIEKDEKSDDIVAHLGGAIWRRQLSFIRKKLGKITDDILQDGMVVSAKVQVDFHLRYGLKLNVQDIDPAYTFGHMALEKERTLERLKKEKLFNRNLELDCPSVIQRVAVISNETAAGYQDFINQIGHNSFGYQFDLTLFETALQGKKVELELPYQLERISEVADRFDLAVIIRGGGSKLDLSAFDHYKVASSICKSPLPVWTGIGHEIDESVSDLIANRALKTPTAVAEEIVSHNYQFEAEIEHMYHEIQTIAQRRIHTSMMNLNEMDTRIKQIAEGRIDRARIQLETDRNILLATASRHLDRAKWTLKSMQEQVFLLDPQSILDKGFLLAERKGKRVRNIEDVKQGDQLNVFLKNGRIETNVTKIIPS